MSAFTLGKQTATVTSTDNQSRIPDNEGPGAAFIKWIPGDAIVLYTALLALGAKQPPLTGHETPLAILERVNVSSAEWFLFALAAAGILVVSGAVNNGQKERSAVVPLLVRVVLTLLAFVLWTTLLPGSWSYQWNLVRDMGDAYLLVLGVVAVVFTAVAQRVSKWTDTVKVPVPPVSATLQQVRRKARFDQRDAGSSSPASAGGALVRADGQ